jgi:hypothetical protein
MQADLAATFASLQAKALAQVPSKDKNHFTGYRLVRIKTEVKTKAGLAFACGEFALATEKTDEIPGLPSSGRYVTVWSRRNKTDLNVRVTDVEWL